ncbi:MAG: hypothetical protein JKY52_11725, partial [Flavobacteriales bacterium]|nr:hypothetical protein [Flavobacteriales bacterium]
MSSMGNHQEEIRALQGPCLSREELVGLTEGTLTEQEQNQVDAHLQNCEMCSMAAQGFGKSPSLAMLGVLDNDLHTMIDTKAPTARRLNAQTMLNVVFGVVIILGLVFFFSQKNELPIKGGNTVISKMAEDDVEDNTPVVSIDEPEEKAAPLPLPKREISAKKRKVLKEPAAEERREIVVANFMPLLNVDVSQLEIEEEKVNDRVRITTNTKYVLDMKTYDYEKFYKREHEETWYNPNLGVPAKYAHSTDIITYNNGPDYKTIWRTYEEILESALTEYKRGRYEKALTSLNLLLDDFPSDINGLFYKGLCLYKKKKYKKSIRYMT